MITYLPLLHASPTPAPDRGPCRRGIGLTSDHVNLADVDVLRAEWWYDWGCDALHLDDPRYVPMSWAGGAYIPLPEDYAGYLLALNEPDNAGQLNINPLEAARRVRETARKYSAARLIIGGVSYFGAAWLAAFVAELEDWRPAGWHVHGYCEWRLTAADVFGWFLKARAMCPGGEFWVTEFADVDTLGQAEQLLDLVREASWINRYAWFANRLSGLESYYPRHWSNPALIGVDGQLTAYGRLYMEE